MSRLADALPPPGRVPGTLPLMIAATTFLAILAVAAALALAHAADALAAAGTDRVTIEVIDADAGRREAEAARAVATLRALPAVRRVARVAPAELAALLEPALGHAALDTLPLPVLIEATLTPGASLAPIRAALAPLPHADLVAAPGLAPLARLVATLRRLAIGIALVAMLATMLVAALAARAALDLHGPTLAVLHALGADDRALAGLVQRRIARDALIGGAIGLAGGAAASWLVTRRVAALGGAWPQGGSARLADGAVLLATPLLLAALAAGATRWTVLARLARTP